MLSAAQLFTVSSLNEHELIFADKQQLRVTLLMQTTVTNYECILSIWWIDNIYNGSYYLSKSRENQLSWLDNFDRVF